MELRPNMIPVNAPLITSAAKKLVNKALSEGWISSSGPYVEQFEAEFAKLIGVQHAVAVSSGTAALHVALLSLGIGVGDEVIVPGFTMAATWTAVLYTGAKPIFVDVTSDTYTIDPKLIEKAITKHTKAIIPVHIYGHPADMDPIMDLAKKYKLFVVEDAAEAHGATYRGITVGSIGDLNAFSFYANKIITTGEGGMITTNSRELATAAARYRDLCHSASKRFIHDDLGYNYRLTSLQAALGLAQLPTLASLLTKKTSMAAAYQKGLSDIPGIILPTTMSWATNVYWMYAIRVDETKFGMTKDQLRSTLLEQGIDTRDFFYPPSVQPVLRSQNLGREFLPISETIAKDGFYLPSGLALTPAQIKEVCATIRTICSKSHKA